MWLVACYNRKQEQVYPCNSLSVPCKSMSMKKESSKKIEGDILVISSDSELKSDISLFLEPHVQTIKFVSDAELVLEKIDEEKPNLILMDTEWNIGNSYALCQKLKTHILTKNIPIILIGNFTEEDKLASCVEAGVNEFISTPFKRLELVMRVKTQLALYFANKHNRRLILTEAFHTSAIRVIKEGFVVHDKNDKIVSANEAAAEILGLTYNQLLGKDSFDPRWKALHEDGIPFAPEDHPSMISLRTGIPVNDVIMNVHAGESDRKWISINSRPIYDEEDNQTGAVATFLDITERKEGNEKLKETLQQLNLAIDTAKLGVWILNIDSGELQWNDKLHEIYGISQEEFKMNMDGWQDQVHPEDVENANTRLKEVYENKSVYDVQFRILHPNGEVRYIDGSASPIFVNNKLLKIIGINRDITNEKLAEKQLKESEEKFANAFDSSPIAQSILNLKTGQRLNVNHMFCKLFGYTREELLNINVRTSNLAVNPALLKEGVEIALKTGRLDDFAFDMYNAKGNIRNIIISATNTFLNDEDIFIVSYSDVTNAREGEKKLKKAEKDIFNAIISSEEKERARYAKELHDGLGPILSTSLIYLHTILQEEDKVKQTEYIKRTYALLEDAIQSIREISSNLSPDILKKYGLVQAVRSFIEKLQEVSKVKFKINSNLSSEFNAIIGFTLYRTITELINNTIKHADANQIVISFDQSAAGIKIVYVDDGSGFDYEKAKKQGKGFGLMNLEGRIKNIGGYYEFISSKEEGTQVEIKIETIRDDSYSYN